MVRETLVQLGQLCPAADERCQLRRKVVRPGRFRGAKRRKVVAQVRMAELHHVFRPRQVTHGMATQIGQPHRVRQSVDDQIGSANTGAVLSVAPEHISGFLPSIRQALLQGRRVLITADHGHTPYLHRDLRVGAGATPRFRELGKKLPLLM